MSTGYNWDMFVEYHRTEAEALALAARMIGDYGLTVDWRKAKILDHLKGQIEVGVTGIEPAAIPTEVSDSFIVAFAITIGDRRDVCPLEFHVNDGWVVGFRHPVYGNVDLYGNGDYREVFASALAEYRTMMAELVPLTSSTPTTAAGLP